MLDSAVRGAYICARCRLRHDRWIQSTFSYSRQLRSQRRYKSTEATQIGERAERNSRERDGQDSRGVFFKVTSPKGRIVGQRGRKQRAGSEPLKIKSLDKDSEVIVLRDLPRQFPETVNRDLDLRDPDEARLDAQELADSISGKKRKPRKDDVLLAIEQHRPRDEMLDAEAYNRRRQALHDSHNKGQLIAYLRRHLWPGKTKPSKKSKNGRIRKRNISHTQGAVTDQADTADQVEAVRQASVLEEDAVVATVDADGDDVKAVPEAPEETADTRLRAAKLLAQAVKFVKLSSWTPDSDRSPSTSAKQSEPKANASNKDEIIESIFRHVWKVRVATDSDPFGSLDIKLSTAQWALLRQRNANDLFSALRDPKLYRGISLTRPTGRDTLRVHGPESQTLSVAQLFVDAFSQIHCLTFQMERSLRSKQDPDRLLLPGRPDELPPDLEKDVMAMTNTVIDVKTVRQATSRVSVVGPKQLLPQADAELQQINVLGFVENGVNEAYRLLMNRLEGDKSLRYKFFTGQTDINESGRDVVQTNTVPIHAQARLPLAMRDTSWRRAVQVSGTTSPGRNSQSKTLDSHQQIENYLGQSYWSSSDQNNMATKLMGSAGFWSSQLPTLSPWRATFGLLLNPAAGLYRTKFGASMDFPGRKIRPPTRSEGQKWINDTPASQQHHLLADIPKSATMLSNFSAMSTESLAEAGIQDASLGPRLVARLIPLPESRVDHTRRILPDIFISFKVGYDAEATEQDGFVRGQVLKDPTTTPMQLETITAVIQEQICDVSLPGLITDIRLSRGLTMVGITEKLAEHKSIKKFIDQAIASFSTDTLRAPPIVSVPLPTNFVYEYQRKSKRQAGDTEMKYLFSGFELRQAHHFTPASKTIPSQIRDTKDVWTVTEIEGGYTGGRRSELSVRLPSDGAAIEGFAGRGLLMAEFIDRTYRGQQHSNPNPPQRHAAADESAGAAH